MVIDVTVVGIGKIARDQHLPAIAGNPAFRLVAAVSRNDTVDGVANFTDFDAYLASGIGGAVAICTPPAVRVEMCLKAIAAGRDLLIEKPPAATIGEIETIINAAQKAGVTLFATWHSRFAPAVALAKDWLEGREISRITINWREDVRRWHPNQAWIWQPGGFGVFDPGINALSILTEIFAGSIHVDQAKLEVPSNCFTPIGAELAMTGRGVVPILATFDWRQLGPQTWDITVETSHGTVALHNGGATMDIDGMPVPVGPEEEYPAIYRRFADLISARASDTDIAPLRICADAYLRGQHVATEAFYD